MVETTFLVGLFFFLLLRKTKSQKVRKVRGVDAELKAIIESDNDATGIAFEIKAFLLSVLESLAGLRLNLHQVSMLIYRSKMYLTRVNSMNTQSGATKKS